MIDQIFAVLFAFEDFLWGYIGFPLIIFLGLYFTFRSNFVQIRRLPAIGKLFIEMFRIREDGHGVHPLKAFFACIGGCVGVGNVVGICTAVQIGGPGALFWIWVTALLGSLVKYAEVYLGMKTRVPDGNGGWNGGPMYFLKPLFKGKAIPNIVALLLCVYGVDVFQFSTVVKSVSVNYQVEPVIVMSILLFLVMFAVFGGVRRVGAIASAVIPVFIVLYVGMGSYVLYHHLGEIPDMLLYVLKHAFTGHAAAGGFVGSTLMMAISQGIRRGCYTGDFGVGYAAIINSESCITFPQRQAALEILGIFLDTYVICTMSVVLILVTNVWTMPIDTSMLVQTALGNYFPHMEYFMPFFLFLLGYSTINAYYCTGIKCARYLSAEWGVPLFHVYGVSMFIIFAFLDTAKAQTIMTIAGGLLLVINLYGIYRLRRQVDFTITLDYQEEVHANSASIPATDQTA